MWHDFVSQLLMNLAVVTLHTSAQTIENTREKDESMVDPADEEVAAAAAQDEFAPHFALEQRPLFLITTCYKPTKASYDFINDLLKVCSLLNNCSYFYCTLLLSLCLFLPHFVAISQAKK